MNKRKKEFVLHNNLTLSVSELSILTDLVKEKIEAKEKEKKEIPWNGNILSCPNTLFDIKWELFSLRKLLHDMYKENKRTFYQNEEVFKEIFKERNEK